MPDDQENRGRVEQATRADIEAVMSAHPMGEALAEMSISMARRLDGKIEDKSVAGINRELRANLVELARFAVDLEDELDDELSHPTDGVG